jgi:hypothetical protein
MKKPPPLVVFAAALAASCVTPQTSADKPAVAAMTESEECRKASVKALGIVEEGNSALHDAGTRGKCQKMKDGFKRRIETSIGSCRPRPMVKQAIGTVRNFDCGRYPRREYRSTGVLAQTTSPQ